MLSLILALMAISVPVAFAFLVANIIGAFVFMGGDAGVIQLINNGVRSVSSFLLVPVPLFIFMGELFFNTGLAARIFSVFDQVFGRVPGRLSYIAVTGGTVFATLSGSSVSTTAMMGAVMVPEMRRRGYKTSMSIGPILGSGSLAILIPPSAFLVLLGSLARIDVGSLLIAGVLPGLILATLYILLINIQLKFDPGAAPGYAVETVSVTTKVKLICTNILPLGLVLFCVVGLIVLGVATPSEAAAFGVLGVLVLAMCYGCLTWSGLRRALDGTLSVTVMVFMIVLGSATFSQILAFSGASFGVIEWATSLEVSGYVMLLLMFGVLLLLGMFVDQISQLMLTVPIFMPLALAYGFDPIWFGIVIVLALEISMTTPPFGLLLFIMQGVAPPGTTFVQIVLAGLPYIGCSLLLLFILILFPDVALFLPGLM